MSIAYQMLQEARNTGEWLEARIHLMFTEIADGMFGEGRLTRDERLALSSAIGRALDAFRGQVEEAAIQLYSRDPWASLEQQGTMSEAATDLDGVFVPLVERAVRRDGTIPVKIIGPGWGTTGYYPAEVLERDGPQIFAPGTQMFWDHATPSQEAERPEGSLNDLAAVLTTGARWNDNGADGPGLYADAKVFEAYQSPINNLAPHIGVSIRAYGKATQGTAEGRQGRIIQGITSASSIDFVTKAGAGGRIVEMFEAARFGHRSRDADQGTADSQHSQEKGDEMSEELQKQLTEAQGRLTLVEQQNSRLREALVLQAAREMVNRELIKHTLPGMTQERLLAQLSANPVVTNAGELDRVAFAQRISEAIQAETTYLATVAGFGAGRIEGMGGGSAQAPDPAAQRKRLEESFRTLGLSEKEIVHAVNGRVG
jgi:hypothetical protein